jgi:DNA-binding IclR family transcriptional regulator
MTTTMTTTMGERFRRAATAAGEAWSAWMNAQTETEAGDRYTAWRQAQDESARLWESVPEGERLGLLDVGQ